MVETMFGATTGADLFTTPAGTGRALTYLKVPVMSIADQLPATAIEVPFGGDVIHAVQLGDEVFVSVSGICQNIRQDVKLERRRLDRFAWARTCILDVRDSIRRRQRKMSSVRSPHRWLNEMKPSRSTDLAKLCVYRQGAADAVAQYFDGGFKPATDTVHRGYGCRLFVCASDPGPGVIERPPCVYNSKPTRGSCCRQKCSHYQ